MNYQASAVSDVAVSVETVWNDGLTFTQSATDVRADVLRIAAGAVIHFRNGITYEITCNKLVVDGGCFFDCAGTDGVSAEQPGHRMPDAYVTLATPNQHAEAHKKFANEWPSRDDMVGYNAPQPTPGGAAAQVKIFFSRFEGTQIDPDAQSNVKGGVGGRGAWGGEGRTLHCTCGATLQAHSGAPSSNAPDGKPGKVLLIPIGQSPVPAWAT